MDPGLNLGALPSPGSEVVIQNFVKELNKQDAQPEMMIILLQKLCVKAAEDWHDGQDSLKFRQYSKLGFIEYQLYLKQHIYEDHGREPIAFQNSRIKALLQGDAIDEIIKSLGLTDSTRNPRTYLFFSFRDYAVATRREPCLVHASVGARSLIFGPSLSRIQLKGDLALKEAPTSPKPTEILVGPDVTDILSGRSKKAPPHTSTPVVIKTTLNRDEADLQEPPVSIYPEPMALELDFAHQDLSTARVSDIQEAYDTVLEDLRRSKKAPPKLPIKDMPKRCDSSWVMEDESHALDDVGGNAVATLVHTALQYTVTWNTVNKHVYDATTTILQSDSFYAYIYWKLGFDPQHKHTIQIAAKNLRILVGISFHSHQYDMLPVFFWGIQIFVPSIIFLLEFLGRRPQVASSGDLTSPLSSPEADGDLAKLSATDVLNASRPKASRGISNVASKFLKTPLSPRISLIVTKAKEAVERLFHTDHSNKASKRSPKLEDYGIPEPISGGIEDVDIPANTEELRPSTVKGKGLGFTFLKVPKKDRKVVEQASTPREEAQAQGSGAASTPSHLQVVVQQEATDSQPQSSGVGSSPALQTTMVHVDDSQDTAAASSTGTSEYPLDQATNQGPRASDNPPSPSNTNLLNKVQNLFQGVLEEIKDTRKRKTARSPGTTSPSTSAGPSRPAKQQKSNKENVLEGANASGSAVAEATPRDCGGIGGFGSQS